MVREGEDTRRTGPKWHTGRLSHCRASLVRHGAVQGPDSSVPRITACPARPGTHTHPSPPRPAHPPAKRAVLLLQSDVRHYVFACKVREGISSSVHGSRYREGVVMCIGQDQPVVLLENFVHAAV